MEPHLIVGVGELLWDLLPEGRRLGGAPANFTVMAGRLGAHAAILSRIGRDELGRRAVELLDPLPADTEFLQVDPAHETGRVTVALKDGQPEYTIHEPAAWDFLELTDDWVRLAEQAEAICFGSLAQRCLESRQTIQTLAAQTGPACVRVFDVNLRRPFYSGEVVQESLELATVVKMNDGEVPAVMGLLGLTAEESAETPVLRTACERLLAEFAGLKLAAVTRGGQGSVLVSRMGWHEHPGVPVKVVDTIGAGDAFTAAMTHALLAGAGLDTSGLARLNEAGNRWGAWVASQRGAMPELSDEMRRQLSAVSRQPSA
jgi:fructokinase